MIIIFIFSEMNGEKSHSKSKRLIESITVSTNSVQDNLTANKNLDGEIKVKENNNQKLNEKMSKYEGIARKLAHASEYAILFLLVINLIYQIKNQIKYKYLIISILYCFLYACTDEFYQHFINGRDASFRDVLIDTAGAIVVCIIVIIIRNNKNRIKLKAKNEI